MPLSRHMVFPHQLQERSSFFQSKWSLLNEAEFLFIDGKALSLGMLCSYFLSGASGNCYTIEFILFYFLFLFLLISTNIDKF